MKIRAGFVSNSSTSSFCIVGVRYSPEEFLFPPDMFEVPEAIERFIEQGADMEYDFEDDRTISSALAPVRVFYSGDEGEGYGYIGVPVAEMEEHETRGKFFARCYEALARAGFKGGVEELSIITGSYRC